MEVEITASAQPSETTSAKAFVGVVAIEVISVSSPTTLSVTELIVRW